MLKKIFKNKSFWIPALVVIIFIITMMVMSKYGVNPLGYTIY